MTDSDSAAIYFGNELEPVDEGDVIDFGEGHLTVEEVVRTGEISGATELVYTECEDTDTRTDVLYRVEDGTINVDDDGNGQHTYWENPRGHTIFNHNGTAFAIDIFAADTDNDTGPVEGDNIGVSIKDTEDLRNDEVGEILHNQELSSIGDSVEFGEEVGADEFYELTLKDYENPEEGGYQAQFELSYPTA